MATPTWQTAVNHKMHSRYYKACTLCIDAAFEQLEAFYMAMPVHTEDVACGATGDIRVVGDADSKQPKVTCKACRKAAKLGIHSNGKRQPSL